MLFRTPPRPAHPSDPRPRLSPEQLAGHLRGFITLASELVFLPLGATALKALGGFSFRGQEHFCERAALGVLQQRALHDADTVARAERLQDQQARAARWYALETLFGHLARQAAQSRLSEQVEANRQGLALLEAIERRLIDDYRAAQASGQPDQAAAIRARNEAIVTGLAPATQVLERNRRRVHDRRLMLRKLREDKAGQPPPRRARPRTGTLAAQAAQALLHSAYAAARRT